MKLAETTSEAQYGPMKVGKWTKLKKKLEPSRAIE